MLYELKHELYLFFTENIHERFLDCFCISFCARRALNSRSRFTCGVVGTMEPSSFFVQKPEVDSPQEKIQETKDLTKKVIHKQRDSSSIDVTYDWYVETCIVASKYSAATFATDWDKAKYVIWIADRFQWAQSWSPGSTSREPKNSCSHSNQEILFKNSRFVENNFTVSSIYSYD